MGVMRLMLSLLVVGSHVGGMGGTPAGSAAIAGFFTISGFLMARTILDNYNDPTRRMHGILRFYTNRAIRLGPPLIATVALTWFALWMRDARPFQNHFEHGVPTGAYMPVDMPASPLRVFSMEWKGFPLFVYPTVALVPQAWSLVTEAGFYFVAPFLVLSFLTPRARIWRWLIPCASVYLAIVALHENWLRSAFSAVWVFWLGMQTYFGMRARPAASSALVRHVALIPATAIAVIACGFTHTSEDAAGFIIAPLTALWLALGEWHVRPSAGLDRMLGNLSYGVFLAHFLGTLVMYWIAEYVFARTGVFGIFGIPDITDLRIHIWGFVFAVLAGVFVYVLFERPFERVRARFRKRPSSPSVPALAGSSTGFAPAIES
jgi:peptidoglycan/LPS O-acetylase OafA/YrhL